MRSAPLRNQCGDIDAGRGLGQDVKIDIFRGFLCSLVRSSMKLTVTSVDYAPGDLYDQTPFVVKLVRRMPGPDRPDYWLGELEHPLNWIDENIEREITYLIIASRWAGTQIEPHVRDLPIGLAYVTDVAQLNESSVDFGKCKYVAIGLATEIEGGNKPEPLTHTLFGNIARAFGMGDKS
jgi:hypothetical protein